MPRRISQGMHGTVPPRKLQDMRAGLQREVRKDECWQQRNDCCMSLSVFALDHGLGLPIFTH